MVFKYHTKPGYWQHQIEKVLDERSEAKYVNCLGLLSIDLRGHFGFNRIGYEALFV